MTTDYSFAVEIGIELSMRQIVRKFGKKVPAEFVTEKRFDPKTGRKLESSKVEVHEEGFKLRIRNSEFFISESTPNFFDITRALKKEFDAEMTTIDETTSPDTVFLVYPKGLRLKRVQDILDYGRASGSGGFLIEELARALPKFKLLENRLKSLGFKVGKPVVRQTGVGG